MWEGLYAPTGMTGTIRECFQTRFVILSEAKDPWQRRPYRERMHGFFTSFRMTGKEYLLGVETLPSRGVKPLPQKKKAGSLIPPCEQARPEVGFYLSAR